MPYFVAFSMLPGVAFSNILRLSVFPWCKDSPQIAMLWWERLESLKWRATGLDASVSFFLQSRRCSRKWSANLLPVSPM